MVPGNAPWPCQLWKQIPPTLLEWAGPRDRHFPQPLPVPTPARLCSQWEFHGANPSQRPQLRVPQAISKTSDLPPVPWILPQGWVWRRAAGAGPWLSLPLPAEGLSWYQSMAGH